MRAILRGVDEAAAVVSEDQGALQGRVRLLAPALFAARQLVPRLARLRAVLAFLRGEFGAGLADPWQPGDAPARLRLAA